MSARSIPNVSEADFPVNGPPRQKLEYALKYAMLAPTELNWQPLEFRVTDAYVGLITRSETVLDSIDPEGRELMISCGSALLCLKLALKHFGCLGRVERFPDLDQPALAARIHFGFGREQDVEDKLLFEAMLGNRANSSSLSGPPLSDTTLAALSCAVAGERGWVEFAQSAISRQRLMELALADGRWRIGADDFRNLSTSPAGHGGATPRSKTATVTVTGWRAARWRKPLLVFKIRRNDSGNVAFRPEMPSPLPTATLAVVKSKTDDKHGWLAAGQAMARTILQAQALGLSWSFFNQAVRHRSAREALRTEVGHKGFAQAVLRFGSLTTAETFRPAATTIATATFR